jgi:hypothetical protein
LAGSTGVRWSSCGTVDFGAAGFGAADFGAVDFGVVGFDDVGLAASPALFTPFLSRPSLCFSFFAAHKSETSSSKGYICEKKK